MTGLPKFWLMLEGHVDDYVERPKCARCERKLKRREKVYFNIAVCPRESGGSELTLPGGGSMLPSVYCVKCGKRPEAER